MTAGAEAPRLDRRFQKLRTRVFERFSAGDPDRALPLALEAEAAYPEKGEVPFWVACAHGASGRPGDALAALRNGLARGLYWPERWLLEDDDLTSLRGDPGLVAVVAESQRLRAAAERDGAAPAPVVLPAWAGEAGRQEAAPRAIAVAFHGWGQTAAEHAAEWTAVAAAGVAIVAPESGQQLTPGFFVWDDREAARRKAGVQVRETVGWPGTGGPPLLLAGFSQGGGLALDLALDGLPEPAAGALALSSGLEDLASSPTTDRIRAAADRGLRVRLVAGERDEALPGARELAGILAAAGVPCPLSVVPDAGHWMPSPGSGRLLAEAEALLRWSTLHRYRRRCYPRAEALAQEEE
jgi:predicted esterase